jgi:predicted ABC-class ATPase
MKIEQLEELKTRNLQLFNWLLETEKENANMRDRLEELGELEELIEDGSIKDRNSTYSLV